MVREPAKTNTNAPIKMIVTDLDNTLLSSDKQISDYSAFILSKCKGRGIITVFATARPERATKTFQIKHMPDYIISNNGATVICGNKEVYNLIIPKRIANEIISAFLSAKEVSYIAAESGGCLYTNYDRPPWEPYWNLAYTNFSETLEAEITKLSVECKDACCLNAIVSKYPELHLYSNSGEDWHQIMSTAATKRNGLALIAASVGLGPDNIAAFGDDYNDIEMLEYCGYGVAVANAIDEVKAVAGDVCMSNDNDGVARWLEEKIGL